MLFFVEQIAVRFAWKETSCGVIMKIVFVLTALAGLVLLSVTLNATCEGKICMRFLKRNFRVLTLTQRESQRKGIFIIKQFICSLQIL